MPRFTGTRYSAMFGGAEAFLPSQLENLAAWYRFNQGITVTGAGVSQWDDQSGNDRHLLQGTDTNRPSKEADGSILFDGVDNYLKTNAFTLNQPETVYLLFKQVTWTSADYIFDGNTTGLGRVFQNASSPGLIANAGASLTQNNDLAVDTYGVLIVIFNGASSSLQVDNNTPTTGNAGANNLGGFTLGAEGNIGSYSNIQVKEAAIYSAAHDAATRAEVIAYLNGL